MPYKVGQRPLMDALSLSPVSDVTEERRFRGGCYIRLYNYCQVLSFLYESGAIIGRALSDKLGILEQMLVLPDWNVASMTDWQQKAKERLDRFEEDVRNEPDTFMRFIFSWELEAITGLSVTNAHKAYERGNKKALKQYDKKVPIEHDAAEVAPRISKAEAKIREFILEGTGFGSLLPELTEKMNRNFYESVDIDWDTWAPRRERPPDFQPLASPKVIYGLPGEPTILSLEAQEETLLQMVGDYAASYYPKLIDPLNLSRYQDEHFTGYSRYSGWWQVYHSLY